MTIHIVIHEAEHYPHPADEIWTLCGAPGEIDKWLPAVERSWLDSDVRHVELAGGAGTAHERITEHVDANHYYEYDYIDGPLALKDFSSRFAVLAAADGGSDILWTAQFQADSEIEGEGPRQAVSGMYHGGLRRLGEVLSSNPDVRTPAPPAASRTSSTREGE